MQYLTFIFIAAAFTLLTLSRLGLVIWQWQRVRQAGGLKPLMYGGLRIDAHQIAVLTVAPAVLSPWLGHIPIAVSVTQVWYWGTWTLLAFMEVSTVAFIMEYDTRPNRLFIEYLKHPREVYGMLWRGHKPALLGGLTGVALLSLLGYALFVPAPVHLPLNAWQMSLVSLFWLALMVLAIRGTLGHRPINPSTVAYCADGLLNTLPLNSLYSVLYAIYSMKNEKAASAVYGNLPAEEMHAIVNACADLPYPPLHTAYPSLHLQTANRPYKPPLNLVIIMEESLGAQYCGHLGGQDLTPMLDTLARDAWTFTRAYATGTRSVRGLEAVVAGFPPTPAQAVVKLPRAQRGFFTLADLLGRAGYDCRFIYGGESHFDNMKAFFLANGFNRVVDKHHFVDPAFVGTWGASDEDMFNQLDRLLLESGDKPSFTLAFSVSNHSPWEYPSGRIKPQGPAATAENTVRYADWALGKFFDHARRAPYWHNTVFLVVADHDSRVFGASLVPVRHFHIPALIVGANVQPRWDDRLISQIDLTPTVLSLIGVDALHPMIGRDLTCATPDRAIMQYGDNYGYLKGDQLIVLTPGKTALQYCYEAPENFKAVTTDPILAHEALAHALWPSWAYREQRYVVPQPGQHDVARSGER
jgi:phosphoglycerol transferase MdoB-like AlkP superfamily enzyme